MRKKITFPAHCFSFLLFWTSKTEVYLLRISSALFSCYSVLAPFYFDSLLLLLLSPLLLSLPLSLSLLLLFYRHFLLLLFNTIE